MTKYLKITDIDSITKIEGHIEPMRNGPVKPEIKGLKYLWMKTSNWPISCTPEGILIEPTLYYVTCDDDADLNITGIISIITEEECNKDKEVEFQARKPPYDSWIGDFNTLMWYAPVPYPENAEFGQYFWDEPTISWKEFTQVFTLP